MLEALGSPGERSILSEQQKAANGDAGEDESGEDGESQRDEEKKRGSQENPGGHQSVHSQQESSESKDEKRRAEKDNEEEPNEDLIKDNKGEPRLSFHPIANGSGRLMRVSCPRRTAGLIEVLQWAGRVGGRVWTTRLEH